ncbi:hypothetical protein [Paenibacillus sp. L3-i20]|uniref:LiaF transmembrane domain-containing protein n=1 Tax=Paenibacillus sp. L3-i20 TaxID=2905833 RepID=UPI001EDF4825|nr:hypothetical protein [Paenibacillus sp. L3-i20]GKU76086.1 hypothetical protein L3i20_v204830 [Paenibacillus sp. L3-i20]
MNGKSALGALLVIVGGLAVLNFLNIDFGKIFSLLLPIILIGFGVVGWMNNKKTIGGILIVIGTIILIGKLGGLLMLLLAIGLIVGGVSMFKNNKSKSY